MCKDVLACICRDTLVLQLMFPAYIAGHARLLGTKVPGKLPEVPMLERMYRKYVPSSCDSVKNHVPVLCKAFYVRLLIIYW